VKNISASSQFLNNFIYCTELFQSKDLRTMARTSAYHSTRHSEIFLTIAGKTAAPYPLPEQNL
jgi:hypothetical protein